MHKTAIHFLSFFVVLFPFVGLAASAPSELPPCIHNTSDFVCFQQNLHPLYKKDFDLFWRSWRHQEDKAKLCSSIPFTSQFISLVVQSDGELAEAMSEFIENLVLTNVGCFLSAADRLDDSTMKHLIRYYLMTPLYHEPSEILPIIEEALKKEKFSKFADAYFNISKRGR